MGGLFDTCGADVIDDVTVPSAITTPPHDDAWARDDAAEVFEYIFDPAADFAQFQQQTPTANGDPFSPTTPPSPLDTCAAPVAILPAAVVTRDDPLMSGEGFFEGFRDLSDYLLGDESMDLDSIMSKPQNTSLFKPEPEFKSESLTSTVALADIIAMVNDEPSTTVTATEAATQPLVRSSRRRKRPASVATNTDHDDYISKRARATREATPSVGGAESDDEESDDEESDASPMTPHEKYVQRRRKNNIASKRSRETRKNKFVVMEERADELETSNERLRARIVELERMTAAMKTTLVKKLTNAA